MLIDDEKQIIEVIEQAVSMIGMDIHSFLNGDLGIDHFDANRADIVIIDRRLRNSDDTNIDGFEIAEQIRILPGGDAAKMILISGEVTAEVHQKASELNFSAVLEKPLSLADLIKLLRELA